MFQRLMILVIVTTVVAALPVLLVVFVIIKGPASLVSGTLWNQQEEVLLRFGVGILLVVVNALVIAVDHVKNPDEWS